METMVQAGPRESAGMKICILGAGALGSALACRIQDIDAAMIATISVPLE
jgi:phosphoglycerate dehydrogenase-like enzyme